MGFKLRQDKDVAEGISRIVKEQIDRGLGEIEDPGIDAHETIHQIRKRCKKIRGVLRLAKPALGEIYDHENKFFRNSARNLSDVRDAEALIETYDKLMDSFANELNRRAFQSVRRGLTMRKQDLIKDGIDIESHLNDFKTGFEQARSRVDSWPLDKVDREVVIAGATKNYAKARDAMKTARANPTVQNLHEWRKLTKYHWCHLRLLKDIWRPVMGRLTNAAKELSDLLGDDHTLAILRATMNGDPDRFGSLKGVDALMGLLNRQRKHLAAQAMIVGQRLYADKPDAFKRKVESYWDAWLKEEINTSFVVNLTDAEPK